MKRSNLQQTTVQVLMKSQFLVSSWMIEGTRPLKLCSIVKVLTYVLFSFTYCHLHISCKMYLVIVTVSILPCDHMYYM